MSMNDQQRQTQKNSSHYQAKLAVHERDRNQCLNCREGFDDLSHLDVDHKIPRGRGGANTLTNLSSLCRRCHEAKHGERSHAPTVRFKSTGDMKDKDFRWFRQLWKQQFPALTETILNEPIEPKFNLSDAPYRAWHIPLGDLRRLDEVLAKRDDLEYAPLGAHNYM